MNGGAPELPYHEDIPKDIKLRYHVSYGATSQKHTQNINLTDSHHVEKVVLIKKKIRKDKACTELGHLGFYHSFCGVRRCVDFSSESNAFSLLPRLRVVPEKGTYAKTNSPHRGCLLFSCARALGHNGIFRVVIPLFFFAHPNKHIPSTMTANS